MKSATVCLFICILIVYIIVDVVVASNSTEEVKTSGSGEILKVHKKKKKERSTSSDSDAPVASETEHAESLDMNESGDSTSSTEKEGKRPKPSIERKGWRVWHRKCKQCPDDMKKKWRDPTIRWICGAYQRARRSFKSKCMMEYRNCQDGTMFVKIHGNRCKNSTYNGDHFFYEYKSPLSGDTTDSKTSTSESTSSNDESY